MAGLDGRAGAEGTPLPDTPNTSTKPPPGVHAGEALLRAAGPVPEGRQAPGGRGARTGETTNTTTHPLSPPRPLTEASHPTTPGMAFAAAALLGLSGKEVSPTSSQDPPLTPGGLRGAGLMMGLGAEAKEAEERGEEEKPTGKSPPPFRGTAPYTPARAEAACRANMRAVTAQKKEESEERQRAREAESVEKEKKRKKEKEQKEADRAREIAQTKEMAEEELAELIKRLTEIHVTLGQEASEPPTEEGGKEQRAGTTTRDPTKDNTSTQKPQHPPPEGRGFPGKQGSPMAQEVDSEEVEEIHEDHPAPSPATAGEVEVTSGYKCALGGCLYKPTDPADFREHLNRAHCGENVTQRLRTINCGLAWCCKCRRVCSLTKHGKLSQIGHTEAQCSQRAGDCKGGKSRLGDAVVGPVEVGSSLPAKIPQSWIPPTLGIQGNLEGTFSNACGYLSVAASTIQRKSLPTKAAHQGLHLTTTRLLLAVSHLIAHDAPPAWNDLNKDWKEEMSAAFRTYKEKELGGTDAITYASSLLRMGQGRPLTDDLQLECMAIILRRRISTLSAESATQSHGRSVPEWFAPTCNYRPITIFHTPADPALPTVGHFQPVPLKSPVTSSLATAEPLTSEGPYGPPPLPHAPPPPPNPQQCRRRVAPPPPSPGTPPELYQALGPNPNGQGATPGSLSGHGAVSRGYAGAEGSILNQVSDSEGGGEEEREKLCGSQQSRAPWRGGEDSPLHRREDRQGDGGIEAQI